MIERMELGEFYKELRLASMSLSADSIDCPSSNLDNWEAVSPVQAHLTVLAF